MAFLHCCLLFAVFIHSRPPFVSSQYLLDTMLLNGPTDTRVKRLAEAVYSFTTDLHKKILESDPDGNVFFSPTSIYVALAMLYPGSGGETKFQLAEALHLDVFRSDETEFYESIQILLQTMSSTANNYISKLANRLYGQKGFQLKDEYVEKTLEYFSAELEALNFKKDPSGSRSKINKWVAGMTSNKIKELFPKDAIGRDTTLVLANAIYFNASWLYPFNKRETKPQTFYASEDQQIQVPMMHLLQYGGLRYASKNQQFRLVKLPYTDETVSMIIVLDEGEDEFSMFLRGRLFDTTWDEEVQVSTDVAVQLSLPKFNLQKTMDLQKSLEALGMENLFENADLSGIADSAPLVLSKAYHKAYIAVSEAGTEAAAATGFQGMAISSIEQTIDFVVDRAFLFFVVEKTTGSVLFFGHIKNPLKSN